MSIIDFFQNYVLAPFTFLATSFLDFVFGEKEENYSSREFETVELVRDPRIPTPPPVE